MTATECGTRIETRFPYRRTRGRIEVPTIRLRVWSLPMGQPAEDGFVVDTGCDFDMVLAAGLRDLLRSEGVVPSPDWMRWGRLVRAERYALRVRVVGRWTEAEAYFPLRPRVDDNLVGLPLLRAEAICLRPPLRETWVGRALG